MGISVCMYVHVSGDGLLEEDTRYFGAVVTGGRELPDLCDMTIVFILQPVLT